MLSNKFFGRTLFQFGYFRRLLHLFHVFQVTQFCHTGNIEVLHNVMLKYMPKRIAFGYKGMRARTMLAIMDNNFNVGRVQATTNDGTTRWSVHWLKATGCFVAKKIFQVKSYDFRQDLLNATIQRVCEGRRLIALLFTVAIENGSVLKFVIAL